METILVYDGSWPGLLTAVFEAYANTWVAGIRALDRLSQQDVFASQMEVPTDLEKAARVWKGLHGKVPADACRQLYCAYLSELPGIEMVILSCARFYFSGAKDPHLAYGKSDVLRITQVAKSVDRERHRMKAFVRFQRTGDDLYYAAVEPDFNVLPLIADHFQHRYADQRWLIYDFKRGYGIYYNLQTVEEVMFDGGGPDASDALHEGEQLYQDLWKEYFQRVNISERKNTKLHLRHVPKRYWRLLTEKW
ncbi:TIGR03915 family putative DNA repair protein [Chitinophaga horti]|uniref:TIGR03915 family putative DNA repair protein n=1 Tax=Chitinophaga horti TaxID=2920382 RepID=A0ABY6J8L5_9BACT|nr:TIGR03915 family putative DNA repair protein [Chitinophaga horti]UYQ94652.1 TIGR03915 family putative DNA repair protein [Chitinophaga horti]